MESNLTENNHSTRSRCDRTARWQLLACSYELSLDRRGRLSVPSLLRESLPAGQVRCAPLRVGGWALVPESFRQELEKHGFYGLDRFWRVWLEAHQDSEDPSLCNTIDPSRWHGTTLHTDGRLTLPAPLRAEMEDNCVVLYPLHPGIAVQSRANFMSFMGES